MTIAKSAEGSEQDWSDFSLMGLFRLEVETQVVELNRGLLEIERADGADGGSGDGGMRDRLERLMRAAHSIKGAARIVQIEAAVTVAHVLEDHFVAALEGRLRLAGEPVDVLLAGVDLLSQLSSIEKDNLAAQLPAYEVEAKLVADSITALAVDAVTPAVSRMSDSDTASAAAQTSAGRMIRISAENLNRLMGLAGESLVEANWLQPFGESLRRLKQQQSGILAGLERYRYEQGHQVDDSVRAEQDIDLDSIDSAVMAMQSAQQFLGDRLSELDLFSRRFSQLSDGLYREVVASHMCAFEEGTKGYDRLVRDLSKSREKQVRLEIEGLATQVDRDILSKLDAPIVHLMTNAVVHGIESAARRQAMGKPEIGTVRVSAMHRAGMLAISVEDDGAGVDLMALRQKVVAKGLTTTELAEQMLEAELLEFLFLPGFSTTDSVDALAGRGYGLDLARNMAQSVGGSLRMFSTLGVGTSFQFQLPLTLSVVRSLLFEVAAEPYALSLARIERVLTLAPEQIHYSESRPYFVMESTSGSRRENVSLVCARQLLGRTGTAEKSDTISVVVLGESGQRYGIRVDRFTEERDLVVRPLDVRLGKVPNVSAAAMTERGEPVLILDVADVVRSAEKIAAGQVCALSSEVDLTKAKTDFQTVEKMSESGPKRVLVVDDSMTVRAMEQKLLQNRGYAVEIAVNGVEGWNAVRMNPYDLVMTDVDMPRMSGIELIEQMRAYGPTQKIPVIVVSYKDREADQMAGANY